MVIIEILAFSLQENDCHSLYQQLLIFSVENYKIFPLKYFFRKTAFSIPVAVIVFSSINIGLRPNLLFEVLWLTTLICHFFLFQLYMLASLVVAGFCNPQFSLFLSYLIILANFIHICLNLCHTRFS